MGPDQATDTIRKALSMGADSGVHVVDDALHGSDALGTSLALAKAIKGRGADLVMLRLGVDRRPDVRGAGDGGRAPRACRS